MALSLCSGVYTLVTVVTIIWDYEVFRLLRAVAFMSYGFDTYNDIL